MCDKKSSLTILALTCSLTAFLCSTAASWAQLNVLLITLDDMNYDSTGITGCAIPGITPHMDALASESLRFAHAHVNIAVCQPVRSVIMTGRYSHRNGAIGFGTYGDINATVPTLIEQLGAAGYYTGILGKTIHLKPYSKFPWDMSIHGDYLGLPADGGGRDPQLYYNYAKSFIQNAQAASKPFFLMANSHDPHHPFEDNTIYTNAQVDIPGFLPDLTLVRTDLARYYTSTNRGDQTVGKVLQALSDTGEANNTLVMCMSDHGMAFPFAKANVWFASSNTPWMVRWPGVVTPNTLDSDHMISTIDFMPTILEVCGLPQVSGMDGTSFLPLLTGGTQTGRDRVYTQFHITAATNEFPMRSVQSKKYGYIYNDLPNWENGGVFAANLQTRGLSWDAMVAAAPGDPYIASRVNLYSYRIREELYDYEVDPDALNNLADDPQYLELLWQYRLELQAYMNSSLDPLAATYTAYLATLPKPPTITQHPSNQSVYEGNSTTFTVLAEGNSPLSYQWQKNQTNLSNGGHYSGCTTATLTIAPADSGDEANYRCVVTNPYGTATSDEATLTLTPPGPPVIIQHPANQQVFAGGAVDFTVTADGNPPLSYQWQKNQSDLSNGGHYAGVTTATLNISNADTNDEANYRCVVTNPNGSVNSNSALLTMVECTPAELLNGGFENIGTGGIAANWAGYTRAEVPAAVSYSQQIDMEVEGLMCQQIGTSYVASGGAGVYQVMTGCISGATYTISGWMKTTSTNCRATVKCAPDGNTSYASAVDLLPPATTTSTSWAPFSGAVIATGSTMTLFLDSQTYVYGSATQAARFDGLAIECGPSCIELVITQHPSNLQVETGGAAQFNVTASGTGPFTYQWQKNQINLDNGGDISGTNEATLNIINLATNDSGYYRCIVTGNCGEATSNEAILLAGTPAEYGDFDEDMDVDQSDLDYLLVCYTGPTIQPANPDCQNADLDSDNDVDQNDFGVFQRCYTGQNNIADPTCAD